MTWTAFSDGRHRGWDRCLIAHGGHYTGMARRITAFFMSTGSVSRHGHRLRRRRRRLVGGRGLPPCCPSVRRSTKGRRKAPSKLRPVRPRMPHQLGAEPGKVKAPMRRSWRTLLQSQPPLPGRFPPWGEPLACVRQQRLRGCPPPRLQLAGQAVGGHQRLRALARGLAIQRASQVRHSRTVPTAAAAVAALAVAAALALALASALVAQLHSGRAARTSLALG